MAGNFLISQKEQRKGAIKIKSRKLQRLWVRAAGKTRGCHGSRGRMYKPPPSPLPQQDLVRIVHPKKLVSIGVGVKTVSAMASHRSKWHHSLLSESHLKSQIRRYPPGTSSVWSESLGKKEKGGTGFRGLPGAVWTTLNPKGRLCKLQVWFLFLSPLSS